MSVSFKLSDYDCIGFDLDNTLVEYDISNMSKLIYDLLAQYLVQSQGYDESLINLSFEEGLQFIQKGLIMDFVRGNVVKVSGTGKVLKACHGTRIMTSAEIEEQYGSDRLWNDAGKYISNILDTWNCEEMGKKLRCALDYFDAPCLLLYARVVDLIDSDESPLKKYHSVWPDIVSGLDYIYDKDKFKFRTGGYFTALTSNPPNFIKKMSRKTMDWLKALRKDHGKFVFLLTGSAADFATFASNFAMDETWDELFDMVLCFARKPNFFLKDRPFLQIENLEESTSCGLTENTKLVSQGNWAEFKDMLVKRTGRSNPSILYAGDNLVQDVLAPKVSGCCDSIAVCKELQGEANPLTSPSEIWGSYFEEDTLWKATVDKYASLCVSSVDVLANIDMNYQYTDKYFYG